jgi:hypothetical protein
MNTFQVRKTENRWSRKLILAFWLVMILIMTPVLMGMADSDIELSDLPRGESFSEPIRLTNTGTTDSRIIRKTNLALIDHAISRLGTGFVYGTYGQVLSESLLTTKLQQYPQWISPYLSYIQVNWLGKPVQDCVGLIKSFYWTNEDGKIIYKLDELPDVSANGLYDAAHEKGPISTLPEIKGIIVWKRGHVGIYIGNGEVIEAHGTKVGVIKTRLTESINDTKWTNWFKCPFIEYVDESNETQMYPNWIRESDFIAKSDSSVR